MFRTSMFALALLLPLDGHASQPSPPSVPAVQAAAPTPATASSVPTQVAGAALPIRFISTIASDEVLATLKANPALAGLDIELDGSPLVLMVTHTNESTSGGQAAGFVTGMLSASTLGIIPIVTNNRLVVRYELLLNRKSVTTYSFERKATRAQNLWATGNGQEGQLGKAGLEWAKSTASEAAAKLAADPALLAVRKEMEFYFPSTTATASP